MALHHRHKHRILTTIVTLIAFVLSIDVFFFLEDALGLEISLLVTFAVGILFLTIYHLYAYEHCHEHATMVNNLTQIYFGAILLAGIIATFILRWLFEIEIINSYIILSLIVIGLVIITLKPFDQFLEGHLGTRFPMHAPSPRKKR